MKKYSVDFFIKKFRKIPANKIGNGSLTNHCALWHVGVRNADYIPRTDEAKAFVKIFGSAEVAYEVNDGFKTCKIKVKGDTPKERIINALLKFKRKLSNSKNKIKRSVKR